jgi:hypothetical protein
MWQTITFVLLSGFVGFIFGAVREKVLNKNYSYADILNASKYGYDYHKESQFPDQEFEDACINNTKQWLVWYNRNKK